MCTMATECINLPAAHAFMTFVTNKEHNLSFQQKMAFLQYHGIKFSKKKNEGFIFVHRIKLHFLKNKWCHILLEGLYITQLQRTMIVLSAAVHAADSAQRPINTHGF